MYRLIFRCNCSVPVPTTRSVSFHTQKWVPLMSCGSVCYHCEDHSWDLFPAFSNHLYRTYFASVRDLYLFTFLFYGKSFFWNDQFSYCWVTFSFCSSTSQNLGLVSPSGSLGYLFIGITSFCLYYSTRFCKLQDGNLYNVNLIF